MTDQDKKMLDLLFDKFTYETTNALGWLTEHKSYKSIQRTSTVKKIFYGNGGKWTSCSEYRIEFKADSVYIRLSPLTDSVKFSYSAVTNALLERIRSSESSEQKPQKSSLEKARAIVSENLEKAKTLHELRQIKNEEGISHCENTINFIKDAVANIAKEFVYIGFKLWECNEKREFESMGYENIADFALSELGFKKSTTYNFINVYKRFAAKLPGVNSYQVTNSCNKFTFSQLCEMLSLSDAQIIQADIQPSDTVKEIREKKKALIRTETVEPEVPVFVPEQVEPEQIEMSVTVKENKTIKLEVSENEALELLKIIEAAEIADALDIESLNVLQSLRTKLMIKSAV